MRTALPPSGAGTILRKPGSDVVLEDVLMSGKALIGLIVLLVVIAFLIGVALSGLSPTDPNQF